MSAAAWLRPLARPKLPAQSERKLRAQKAKAMFTSSQPAIELYPWEIDILSRIDYVPCNLPKSNGVATLRIFEDNDAVIKLICKGRSVTLRYIARTHRVDLDWLIERIREDPGCRMKYVNTKSQIADMLTKGSFTAQQ